MPRSQLRVLVAEDNATNLEVCCHFLEKARVGHVETAENGVEVMKVLGDEPKAFDLILMDVRMPEKDGIETTREIIERWPSSEQRPRIVALTAHAFVEETRRCLDAGMDACLSKPLRAGDLETVIDRVLNEPENSRDSKTGQPGDATPGADLIDWRQFDMIVDAPDSPCVDILRDFVASVPGLLEKLQVAAAESGSETVADVAHQLKGSAASFGFTGLSRRMREAEEAARSGGDWLTVYSGTEWLEQVLAVLAQTVSEVETQRRIEI